MKYLHILCAPALTFFIMYGLYHHADADTYYSLGAAVMAVGMLATLVVARNYE